MSLRKYLEILVEEEGSDLYLSTGAPPSIKKHGRLIPINDTPLKNSVVDKIAQTVMDDAQCQEFAQGHEMNLALSESGIGRFRVNIFQQRNETSMVIRRILSDIPQPEYLGLPPILKDCIMQKRGLILFVGATGSGKSTSLASLIDHRNKNTAGHIITIEDPIEYTHRHKKSIVNQREVGVDTMSYSIALKNTLRQAPDVILIGEIRAKETMEHAIAFSETGHLCMSTLHANNANQAMERIINFFPKHQCNQILLDISMNLVAIVSQRLIPSVDNKRVAVFEILMGTPLIRDLIKRGEIGELKEVMEKSTSQGMLTFDHSIFEAYKAGKITLEKALQNADSQNNLRLKISLDEGVEDDAGDDLETINIQREYREYTIKKDDSDLSLVDKEE